MVCGTLLAGGVLQMKREQAGKAGAAPTSRQQGDDWLLKDADGAASGDQVGVRLERTHRVQFCPRVHVHLRKSTISTVTTSLTPLLIFILQMLIFARLEYGSQLWPARPQAPLGFAVTCL